MKGVGGPAILYPELYGLVEVQSESLRATDETGIYPARKNFRFNTTGRRQIIKRVGGVISLCR